MGVNIVQEGEGERMMRRINANQFLECSAKNNENINEVIYEAVRASVAGRPSPPETSTCQQFSRFIHRVICCQENDSS